MEERKKQVHKYCTFTQTFTQKQQLKTHTFTQKQQLKTEFIVSNEHVPVLRCEDSPDAAFFELEFDTSIGFAIEIEFDHFNSFDSYQRAR